MITLTTFMNVGYNDATLEHHIRIVDTTIRPSIVGLIFLVSGLIYAICSQGWGFIINKCTSSALPFSLIGYILSLAFFVLSGPMYPIPFEPSLTLIIIAQSLYGISMGGQLVGSFTEGLRQLKKLKGYDENDISTSAAMSSLYQAACALGAAIGPIFGGALMDKYGYAKASISMVLVQIIMIALILMYMAYEKCREKPNRITAVNLGPQVSIKSS
jgi:predicted MFS family arabinose efflux permease